MTAEKKDKVVETRYRAVAARQAAIKQLIDNHRDEFDALYTKEANSRGVTTRREARSSKIERMRKELAELEAKQ